MTDLKKLLKQYWQSIFLATIAIVLVTIVSAIGGDARQPGSSYSIAANGYSSWYQMMVDRGIKIQRWQKSFPQLVNLPADKQGTTLLQINPKLEELQLTELQRKWVSQGNTLAILGVTAPAGEIPFRADLKSDRGDVRIETTRRFRANIAKSELLPGTVREAVLSDRFGNAIVQFKLAKGLVIIATTPHLAANAYQDFRPNYELLAELVTKDRKQVLVDEYIHGYVDRKPKIDPITGKQLSETDDDLSGDTLDYLASTPLMIVFINLLLGIVVLIWQQNRRFGRVVIPKLAEINNSEAYIQALGAVLERANSTEFAIEKIGKVEQLSWQQKLGLGTERLVESQTLITAWENQTQLPTDDLRYVLQLATGERRLTSAELQLWLAKVRSIGSKL
jgi:hypothetical protein